MISREEAKVREDRVNKAIEKMHRGEALIQDGKNLIAQAREELKPLGDLTKIEKPPGGPTGETKPPTSSDRF